MAMNDMVLACRQNDDALNDLDMSIREEINYILRKCANRMCPLLIKYKRTETLSFLSKKKKDPIIRAILGRFDNFKVCEPIYCHPTQSKHNWNYIAGYLLNRDALLLREMDDLKSSVHLSRDIILSDLYCYHQLVHPSPAVFIDKCIRHFCDVEHMENAKLILNNLCTQCRCELIVRLPSIMEQMQRLNEDELIDDNILMNLAAFLFNNLLSHYHGIKLLFNGLKR